MDRFLLVLANVIFLPAISAALGAMIKGRIEDSRLFKLRDKLDLSGRWLGRMNDPGKWRQPLTIEFVQHGWLDYRFWLNPKLVTGAAFAGRQKVHFHLRGGFYSEDHLSLEYRAADKSKRLFGTMMLKLDAESVELSGKMVGKEKNVFCADVFLKKEGSN